VQASIDIFNNNENVILAIAPEGTRKKVSSWKTGFYYIAKGANVPIIFNTFDFGKKQYYISEPYYLVGDIKKDFKYFHNFYKDIKGKYPEDFDVNFHKNV